MHNSSNGQLDCVCLCVYLLVHKVYGTARVDVHKVHIDVVVEELSTAGHGVRETSFQLKDRESPWQPNE